MGTFEHDTTVIARPDADKTYECVIDASWWVVAGPNGGYLAAIAIRALEAEFGATERPLRSLTMRYLRAPQVGPATVEVISEREGRSVTFAAVRMIQDDRPFATGAAILVRGHESLEHAAVEVPAVDPAAAIEAPPVPDGSAPPYAGHFDFRPAIHAAEGQALTGGWMRVNEDRPLDQPLVAAMCDSWFPAVFSLAPGPMAVPTLDLTVYLRAPLPLPQEWVLGRFETRVVGDGLLEEDAELFSADGRLLAQSRQLALAR